MVRDVRLVPIAGVAWVVTLIILLQPQLVSAVVTILLVALAAVIVIVHIASQGTWREPRKGSHHEGSNRALNRSRSAVVLAVVVCAAGLICTARVTVENAAVAQSEILSAASQGYHANVVVKVKSDPKSLATSHREAGYWFTAQIVSLETHGATTHIRRNVRVFMEGMAHSGPVYGSTIVLQGTLRSANPGEQSVALLSGQGDYKELTHPRTTERFTNTLRADLITVVEPMSPQARALVPGAAIGDTRLMSPEQTEHMQVSGLTHITAVSGSHFAIIFLIVSALTRKLPRAIRALIMVIAGLSFVGLVHPSGAVLRALVMGMVSVYAMTRKRNSQGLAGLSVAMIVLLMINPYNATDFGFALSVLATAGLIAGSSPIARFLHRPRNDRVLMPKHLAYALAVPLAAQLAVGPVLLLLQPYVSLYSVPANILAAPALAPAMLLGLAATAFAGPFPSLAVLLAHGSSAATWWISIVAQVFSGLGGSKIPWVQGIPGAALLAILTAAALWVMWSYHHYARWTVRQEPQRAGALPFGGRWRKGFGQAFSETTVVRQVSRHSAWLHVVAVVLLGCGFALCVFLAAPNWLHSSLGQSRYGDEWMVAACDVGQGDAFVAKGADGQTYMFDVGPEPHLAEKCVLELGVEHIDTLFISHFHADHYAGLRGVLSSVTVTRIVTGPIINSSGAAAYVLGLAQARGIEVTALGGKSDLGIISLSPRTQGLSKTSTDYDERAHKPWQVLWPQSSEVERLNRFAQQTGKEISNNLSLTVSLELVGGERALFLGDLEEDGQGYFARWLKSPQQDISTNYDIVKVAHHGSASQSSELAKALAPRIALVGVGGGNSYGHPTRQALDMYSTMGSNVLRTDECGTFAVGRESERWFVVGACP